MSVLYKALQKAEKENEQRQAATTGLDTEKLVGSGAVRLAGGARGLNWRLTGLAAAAVLAIAIGAAFFLVDTSPAPRQVAALPVVTPPPAQAPAAPQAAAPQAAPAETPASAPAAPEAPQAAAPAATPPTAPAAAPQQVAAAPAAATSTPPPVPAAPAPEPQETVVAKVTPPPAKPASAPKAPAVREPMPELAADSPARMLNPPIAINRSDFALSGVGKAVQVREVSQEAQDSVGAGYQALLRGEYDTALGFYDRALQKEPRSVLALLGRGAALQRLHRSDDAQASYDRVLKIDPVNREALTNITTLVAERSPAEALNRLLDLERANPGFSPIKAQIGLTYAKMGSMQQALEYLRRAEALSPESVMYQYNLALVLDHLGLRDQAVAAYEKVIGSLTTGRSAPELSATEIQRRVRYLRAR